MSGDTDRLTFTQTSHYYAGLPRRPRWVLHFVRLFVRPSRAFHYLEIGEP